MYAFMIIVWQSTKSWKIREALRPVYSASVALPMALYKYVYDMIWYELNSGLKGPFIATHLKTWVEFSLSSVELSCVAINRPSDRRTQLKTILPRFYVADSNQSVVSQTVSHSITQLINQSISQSINQTVNQSIDQSIDRSIDWLSDWLIDWLIDLFIYLLIDRSIDQSIHPSIHKSINQWNQLVFFYVLFTYSCVNCSLMHNALIYLQ